MPDTKVTSEHATHEPKKTGCCGGDHGKDEKSKPYQKQNANPSSDRKHEHVHQSGADSGCCGGSKANK